MGMHQEPPRLAEPFAIVPIYAHGITGVAEVAGDMHFLLFVEQVDADGDRERVIVGRIIMAIEGVLEGLKTTVLALPMEAKLRLPCGGCAMTERVLGRA